MAELSARIFMHICSGDGASTTAILEAPHMIRTEKRRMYIDYVQYGEEEYCDLVSSLLKASGDKDTRSDHFNALFGAHVI